jgi:glutamate N-acetyltransferase/amino-acid N-acetyltransferase
VAKAIVNSPLVKTAVHGADPNWGRVAMAVGKCTTATRSTSRGDHPLRHAGGLPGTSRRRRSCCARRTCAGDDVLIHVSLATGGTATATVWGCDLTDGYVRINADYTT